MCLFRLYNDEAKCSERSMEVELPAYLKKMNDNYEKKYNKRLKDEAKAV